MKQGAINPNLKAKIDSLKKAIDSYTRCLALPYFDDKQEFLMRKIRELSAEKTEMVEGI